MKKLLKCVPALIALAVAVPAQAAISLSGTIRDFNAPMFNGPNNSVFSGFVPGPLTAHPDFEFNPFVPSVDTGMVASTLTNGVPVYIGAAPYGEVTSAASFAQWFVNVPNVNLSVQFNIVLNETAPNSGVFEYVNNSFFPIDGQLGGNQGHPDHNFHFTYHIKSSFTYVQGQTFSFEGDDDVWVFINGKLAVDIGGIHQVALGTVNLDAVAASLGITPGGTYSFDFFFAERHTGQSNFKISTTIPLRAPDPNPNPSVPEPASLTIWSLLCAGLGCAAARRRRLAG